MRIKNKSSRKTRKSIRLDIIPITNKKHNSIKPRNTNTTSILNKVNTTNTISKQNKYIKPIHSLEQQFANNKAKLGNSGNKLTLKQILKNEKLRAQKIMRNITRPFSKSILI